MNAAEAKPLVSLHQMGAKPAAVAAGKTNLWRFRTFPD
jgi:hypothetical protein